MIEAIREWTYILLITAMAGTLASLLAPQGALSGYVRLACAAVAVAAVIAPLGSVLKYIAPLGAGQVYTLPAAARYEAADAAALILERTEAQLESAAREFISDRCGIICPEINIHIEKGGSGGISVTGVDLYIPPGGDVEALASAARELAAALGCGVEVMTVEGGAYAENY